MRSREARRPRRFGSETPRIFTPPLRDLADRQNTLGYDAIEFAQDVCGVELYPWQRWLLVHALELDPALTVDTMGTRGRLDPLFRFRKVVVLVARQNGKSTLSQVLSLFFLYQLGTDLVLGTAQDLDTAEEVWDGALEIIEETPELAELADKPIRVNGKKTIVLKTGERYKVKAANRRAGRGLSGDLILLDELREHQSWDAWGAITKTTNARAAAQIWALSNAGDATSVVLRYLRKTAHGALGDPDGLNADDDPASLLPDAEAVGALTDLSEDRGDLEPEDFEEDLDTLGIFEWSAPPGCSVLDRDGWVASNPSLGYGISERTLAGDAKGDPEWIFRTECLCQWSDGSLEGPFPPGTWEAGTDPESARDPGSEVVASVDVSHDHGMASVQIAAWRPDGKIHVEVVARRAGVDWLKPWFRDDAYPHRAKWRITGQTNGAPASSVLEDLAAPYTAAGESTPRPDLEIVPWQGPDLGRGCGGFYDLVRGLGEDVDGRAVNTPGVYHRPQPALDVAAATAVTKPLGDGWVWDRRKSPVDIAPLVGVTAAAWLLGRPAEKPAESAYETRGVLTI